MTFDDPLSIAGVIIAVIISLGGTVATLRSNLMKQTITEQKSRIENLEGMLADRDRQLEDLTAAVKLARAETELLKERLSHLEEIVSGRIDFSAIHTALDAHHAEVTHRLDSQHKVVADSLRDIKRMLQSRRVEEA